MTRAGLIARAREILAEAYEEAAYMVAAYIEKHPDEQLQTLCKEIDPENWNALRARVQRAQGNRKSASGDTSARAQDVRAARRALRHAQPDELRSIVADLPVEQRAAVVRAAIPPPDRVPTEKQGPTFIELLVRISSGLIELEAMVATWQNRSAVPPEFSRESFTDIATKTLRIRDLFDQIADASDDEFMRIVRGFRVVTDAQ